MCIWKHCKVSNPSPQGDLPPFYTAGKGVDFNLLCTKAVVKMELCSERDALNIYRTGQPFSPCLLSFLCAYCSISNCFPSLSPLIVLQAGDTR